MKPKKSTAGRKPSPGVPTNTRIREDLRKKLDDYKASKKWSLRTAIESILESFFGGKSS